MSELTRKLLWNDVYREVELYKAALRVYTKPVFGWRKALFTSTDGRTFYDLAARGLATLDQVHDQLRREQFQFRPAVALHYNFNGKHRTLYIAPWEERIVDLLLYRILTRQLQGWLSPNAYAYRDNMYGLDRCQSRIARILRECSGPIFVVKRDITAYFDSIHHETLLARLRTIVAENDYLYSLLKQRIRFEYADAHGTHTAQLGVPFGTAIACAFANIYLTPLDRAIESVPGVHYFRYADDLLALAPSEASANSVCEHLRVQLAALKLTTKSSHELDGVLGAEATGNFTEIRELRHLGLQFSATGDVSLSRDKSRKIQNLFRFAFRRTQRRWQRLHDPSQRAAALVQIAADTLQRGVRNVAIIDYYLRHVTDEQRLRGIDQWLAEEILANVFGGHKKKHFQRITFMQLRRMGLPSVVHRRRLLLRRKIETSFFVWQQEKAERAFRGTVARL